MTLYFETEMAHAGIKGMRWGHRKYQYKDGSLTPAGRKRYLKNVKDDLDKKDYKKLKKEFKKSDDILKRANMSPLEIDEILYRSNKKPNSKTSEKPTEKTNDKTVEKPPVKKPYSEMTTAELKKVVESKENRDRLERKYNEYFAPDNVSKGQVKVSDYLAMASKIADTYSKVLDSKKSININKMSSLDLNTESGKKEFDKLVAINKKVKSNIDTSKQIKTVTDGVKVLNDNAVSRKRRNKPKLDLRNLTDDQLKEANTRKDLEDRYEAAFGLKSKKNGRAKVMEYLNVVGNMADYSKIAYRVYDSYNKVKKATK